MEPDQNPATRLVSTTITSIDTEQTCTVKNHVERFLTAVGEGNLDVLPDMFVANANIGTSSMKDGSWIASTMTFEEWMTSLRERTAWTRFGESVSEFTVHIEDSMMAFVRAAAASGRIPVSRYNFC